MRNRNKLSFLFLIFAAVPFSCSEEKHEEKESNLSHELYRSLLTTYKDYAESLAVCDDTVGYDSLIMRLDEKIRKAYADYPADLDFDISEAENDTLWKYASRIAALRNRASHRLRADSVSSDSLPQDND